MFATIIGLLLLVLLTLMLGALTRKAWTWALAIRYVALFACPHNVAYLCVFNAEILGLIFGFQKIDWFFRSRKVPQAPYVYYRVAFP